MTFYPYSIRSRLMLGLVLAVAFATLLEAGIAYRVALSEVDEISDYHMIQVMSAMRRGIPEPTRALRHEDLLEGEDRCFTLVAKPRSEAELNASPPQTAQGLLHNFSMRTVNGRSFRVLTSFNASNNFEVIQDMNTRRHNAQEMALRSVLPILLLAPILALFVWLGIAHILRPLVRSRNEIAHRNANDLQPLKTDGVPDEIRPFITEINVLFARISKAFAIQQNFVANAAHELRSPLAALKLQVQGLQRVNTAEAKTLAVERLVAGVDRATRLVEQLLVLAREEATTPDLEHTNLPTIARLALSDIFPLARELKVDIGASLSESEPDEHFMVTGNVEALRTLLRNLLENAVKYASPPGVVNLALLNESGCLSLCVEDNGPGIPPEESAQVFDRFQRGSTHDRVGSGLGLSIVKAIADRHGITMELGRSTRLGGLSFTLRFPTETRS